MNDPMVFHNDEFEVSFESGSAGGFRVYAPLLSKQLGYRDSANMIRHLEDDEKVQVKGYSSLSTPPELGVWYVTEPGFYKIVGQRNINLILDTAEILIPRYAHPSMKTASLARHTGGREMSNSNDGALFSIKVQANDGTVLADINFPVTAWDLANADNWQSMFFEPANEVIVSQLKRRIDQQAAA